MLPPTNKMRQFQAPSESSSQLSDDLSKFLSNNDYRKQYNKLLSLAKKFRNTEAKKNFLENCISENLVPNDFNCAKRMHGDPKYNSVNNATSSAAFEWMKIAVEDNAKLEKEIMNELTNSFNFLCQLAPENVREELKDRLHSKSFSFKHFAESEKVEKLSKLRNGKSLKNVQRNDKKKNSRKWIKRSKYKRIQKSKLKEKVAS